MGFTSLSALDLCGNVGNVYTSTTFAFGPSELSTIGSPLVSSKQLSIDGMNHWFWLDSRFYSWVCYGRLSWGLKHRKPTQRQSFKSLNVC